MGHILLCLLSLLTTAPQAVNAQVIFSWQGSKDNHLSLVRGEVVCVLEQREKWWSGEYQGKVGWFPKTFVKILDTPPSTQQADAQVAPTSEGVASGGLYEAIYEYVGETEGDLTFQAGDIIEVNIVRLHS